MKDKISILIFIVACVAAFFYLRGGEKGEPVPYLLSYELGKHGDTINKVDLKGLRQGLWCIYHYSEPLNTGGDRNQWLDSVGTYKDGKKEGYWTKAGLEEIDSIHYVGCKLELDPDKTYPFAVEGNIIFADTTIKTAPAFNSL